MNLNPEIEDYGVLVATTGEKWMGETVVANADSPDYLRSFALPVKPEGMGIDAVTGRMTWVPGAELGLETVGFQVVVSDGRGGSGVKSGSIYVNTPPSIGGCWRRRRRREQGCMRLNLLVS